MRQVELYTSRDLSEARRIRNIRLYCFFAVCALALAAFGATLILRVEIPGLIATALLSCVAYFVYSTKVSPHNKYCRYLKALQEGLTRETEGVYVSMASDTRMVDGVEVYDFIISVEPGEMGERLFLWDANKPRPTFAPEQEMKIISHSNFIKAIQFLN